MKRRQFIAGIGATSAWALAARAQQQPARPVIGFLSSASPAAFEHFVRAFKEGLSEVGYVDGENVSIEYRWAEDRYEQLPAMAAELVSNKVKVILASGGPVPALKARAATATIPIVFPALPDPVKLGLVASFNRPGGNVTGIAALTSELDVKRLEILGELVPKADVIGVLLDPNREAEGQSDSLKAAARALGRRLVFANAGNEHDFEPAFAALAQKQAGALLVGASALFVSLRSRLVELAARHSIPAIYQFRSFAVAGGLVSYGSSGVGVYRQAGIYVGKILKGDKPADLPVIQPTKLELVINLKTAKALGLTVPPALLASADDVVE